MRRGRRPACVKSSKGRSPLVLRVYDRSRGKIEWPLVLMMDDLSFVPDDCQLSILAKLALSGARLSQKELTGWSEGRKVTRSSVQRKLPELEALGLMSRPTGPRSGFTITLRGRRLLWKFRARLRRETQLSLEQSAGFW